MPLEGLTFAKFEFCLAVQGQLLLPAYKGAVFRGAFGHAFKRVVCVSRQKDCEPCLIRHRCVYSYNPFSLHSHSCYYINHLTQPGRKGMSLERITNTGRRNF